MWKFTCWFQYRYIYGSSVSPLYKEKLPVFYLDADENGMFNEQLAISAADKLIDFEARKKSLQEEYSDVEYFVDAQRIS